MADTAVALTEPKQIPRSAAAQLALAIQTTPAEVDVAQQSARVGVSVRAMVLQFKPAPAVDKSAILTIWVVGNFKIGDIPLDVGEYVSPDVMKIYTQERYGLSPEYIDQCKANGIKLSAKAKYTMPVMGPAKLLHWGEVITLFLYGGKGSVIGNRVVAPGDSVVLTNLFWDKTHKLPEGVKSAEEPFESWQITGMQRSMPVDLADINYMSALGYTNNELVDFRVSEERSQYIDPALADVDAATKNTSRYQKAVRRSQLSPLQQKASQGVYCIPLQSRGPDNVYAKRAEKYVVQHTWDLRTGEDKTKRKVITSATLTAIQINENADGTAVAAALSFNVWASNLQSFLIINEQSKAVLEGLLKTVQGALLGTPNIMAISEVSDGRIQMQINCNSANLRVDMTRLILLNGMEIPNETANYLLKPVEDTRNYFTGKNPANVAGCRVINLNECNASVLDPAYRTFFVSSDTMPQVKPDGTLEESPWKQLVARMVAKDFEIFWPYWRGTTTVTEGINPELKAGLPYVKFNPGIPFVIFSIRVEDVVRVINSPSFPDEAEALRIYTSYQNARKAMESNVEDAVDQAEKEYMKKKAAEMAAAEAAALAALDAPPVVAPVTEPVLSEEDIKKRLADELNNPAKKQRTGEEEDEAEEGW